MSATEHGILACGACLPRWRIAQSTIAEAIGWTRGRAPAGSGSRGFANWDEDALTLAVEAGRDALARLPGIEPGGLDLASTTLPFADRSNAGLVREALHLAPGIALADRTGSRRAGTTALLDALEQASANPRLVCASDCVDTRPGSEGEAELGHGAAALVVGRGTPLATLVAQRRLNQDFVDRYRQAGARFDYRLEARWVRDAGTRHQLAAGIAALLDEAGVSPGDIDWWLLPADTATAHVVARDAGLADARTADEPARVAGDCGVSQPLLLLTWALARAEPGQLLLLAGLGQGFDLMLLRAGPAAGSGDCPVSARLEAMRTEDNYTRFLGMRRLLDIDPGLRAERDNRSAQSAAWRRHEELTGFVGGRCDHCGRLQFPRAAVCVHCGAEEAQQPEPMANLPGSVNSFTEDWLAYTPRPPLIFGNVHFPDGANAMLEFTDFQPGELAAGQSVRLVFRIKDFDERRGFRRYFWKPAPPLSGPDHG